MERRYKVRYRGDEKALETWNIKDFAVDDGWVALIDSAGYTTFIPQANIIHIKEYKPS